MTIRHTTLGLCLAFCVTLVACSDNNLPSNNTTADVTADTTDARVDEAPVKICDAGTIRCRQENTPSIDVCQANETEYAVGSCQPNQVCREDVCVDVACVPNTRRCGNKDGELIPQVCDEQGNVYVDGQACRGGSRCEGGNCLNRCEQAENARSYIGCEYWAVELENHLLYEDDTNPLPADRQPPFAIVLANTSTEYDAKITVTQSGGEPAQAVESRVVGSDIGGAGINYETVRSEVLDAQGNVLQSISGDIKDINLPRGALVTLIMPQRRIPFAQTTITNGAYKVTSTQPVVAYQFNPLCCNYNYTNDASLLLPKGALTENYMYMSYAVWAGGVRGRVAKPYSPTMTVMATEADTQVTVQLPAPKGAGRRYDETIYPVRERSRISGPNDQGRVSVTLQPYEVFNLSGAGRAPAEDLTGARISASKPVAVFGAHSCANVPFGKAACDHMESQLFPIETWGQRFVLAPLKLRRPDLVNSREGTYWKFVARENQTTIRTGFDLRVQQGKAYNPADENVKHCEEFSDDPASGTFTLGAGQTCEFGTKTELVALANKPIMIGAFLSGQNSVQPDAGINDRAGDPAFFLVPPEEQYRSSYSFLTPKTYFQSYVTVTIRPGFGVLLDGMPLNLESFDYVTLDAQGVARAHIPVEPGPHQIESNVPFGIVVYGYDSYVSYAYTGGLNLTKLSPL